MELLKFKSPKEFFDTVKKLSVTGMVFENKILYPAVLLSGVGIYVYKDLKFQKLVSGMGLVYNRLEHEQVYEDIDKGFADLVLLSGWGNGKRQEIATFLYKCKGGKYGQPNFN